MASTGKETVSGSIPRGRTNGFTVVPYRFERHCMAFFKYAFLPFLVKVEALAWQWSTKSARPAFYSPRPVFWLVRKLVCFRFNLHSLKTNCCPTVCLVKMDPQASRWPMIRKPGLPHQRCQFTLSRVRVYTYTNTRSKSLTYLIHLYLIFSF